MLLKKIKDQLFEKFVTEFYEKSKITYLIWLEFSRILYDPFLVAIFQYLLSRFASDFWKVTHLSKIIVLEYFLLLDF